LSVIGSTMRHSAAGLVGDRPDGGQGPPSACREIADQPAAA
jgi:hypothetical protein